MDKIAIAKRAASNIDRLIMESIAEITQLPYSIEELIEAPSGETAENVDAQLNLIANHLEAVKNAITVMARQLLSEDGTVEEIAGVEEQDGIRLQ